MKTKTSKKMLLIILVLLLAAALYLVFFGPYILVKEWPSGRRLIRTNSTIISDKEYPDVESIIYYTPFIKRMKDLKSLSVVGCTDLSFLKDTADLEDLSVYCEKECVIDNFEYSESLRSLYIGGNSYDYEVNGWDKIKNKAPNLRIFEMRWHNADSDFCDMLSSFEHLEEISCQGTNYFPELKGFHELKRIEVNTDIGGEYKNDISECLEDLPSLESIHFRVGSEKDIACLGEFKTLKEIGLDCGRYDHDINGWVNTKQDLSECKALNDLPELECLSFEKCDIEGLEVLADCPNLKSVLLTDCNCADSEVTYLSNKGITVERVNNN